MRIRLNRFRVPISILSSFALFIALGRCSPLLPSINKSMLTGPQTQNPAAPPALPTPSSMELSGPQASGTSAEAPKPLPAISFNVRVIAADEYSAVLEKKTPKTRRITLSDSALQMQFDELKKTGKTAISIDGPLPSEARVYVAVSFSQEDLSAQELDSFNLKITPYSHGVWILQVSKTTDPAIAQQVLGSLLGVTISFSSDELLPEPSPAPSPSTEPSPVTSASPSDPGAA